MVNKPLIRTPTNHYWLIQVLGCRYIFGFKLVGGVFVGGNPRWVFGLLLGSLLLFEFVTYLCSSIIFSIGFPCRHRWSISTIILIRQAATTRWFKPTQPTWLLWACHTRLPGFSRWISLGGQRSGNIRNFCSMQEKKRTNNNFSSHWLEPDHRVTICINLGVSKNRGTPKWMVYNGKPY